MIFLCLRNLPPFVPPSTLPFTLTFTCVGSVKSLKEQYSVTLSFGQDVAKSKDARRVREPFLALLLLPLAGGPKDGKRFDADWRLISSTSFHTRSDNCERNTQKCNSNNKDSKKETIKTLMWLRRSCGGKRCEWSRMFCNDASVNF